MRRTTSALALLAAAIVLAGCGSSGESADPATSLTPTSSPTPTPTPTSTPTPTPTPTPSESADGIEVTVAGKKVTPAPATIKAEPGEEFSLTLTTDRSGELHVHGVDPEFETEIKPGTKTYTFTLTSQPGVYEVELHDPDLLLFEIKVQ